MSRCSLLLTFVWFWSLFFLLPFFSPKQQSFPGGEGRNERGSSLGVTNVFPQHKSRTQAFLCVCICICVSTGFDTNNRITESNSILFCPFVLSLMSPCWPSVCPFCLSYLWWHEEKPVRMCLLLQQMFFFMQIITLIMLFSTSFPSCLSDKTHQCGLSMAEYTHPWYPVQFSIDRRCSVPESWHTVLCFDDCLDHFLFFPCQDLPVPTPFLLTEWLLLRFSSSV